MTTTYYPSAMVTIADTAASLQNYAQSKAVRGYARIETVQRMLSGLRWMAPDSHVWSVDAGWEVVTSSGCSVYARLVDAVAALGQDMAANKWAYTPTIWDCDRQCWAD